MINKVLAYSLLVLASLGFVQVSSAIFFQHPELAIRAYFRPDLR